MDIDKLCAYLFGRMPVFSVQLLASGSEDCTVRLWDVRRVPRYSVVRVHANNGPHTIPNLQNGTDIIYKFKYAIILRFHPNVDRTIRCRSIKRISGTFGGVEVSGVLFGPNGHNIFASSGKRILQFDLRKTKACALFEVHIYERT